MFEKSPIPRWRTYKERYRLQGCKCTECNVIYYPSKYLCKCGSQHFESVQFKGTGTLLTFTKIHVPSIIFTKRSPYIIGMVRLDEGPKIIAQITDMELEKLKIGIKLQAVFRLYSYASDKGIIHYGIKFIPI